jgi:Zn-dependent peptidase ImmA (M78 family)
MKPKKRERYDKRQVHVKIPQYVELIKERIADEKLLAGNESPKSDIFRLLEKRATVFYFPRENHMNKGYYYNPSTGRHLVYINTSRNEEKQAFSAAHELGHVLLGVIPWVDGSFPESDIDIAWSECVISRFASELMMPEEQFRTFVKDLDLPSLTHPDSTHEITHIMHRFFVPYRAVVYRFRELNIIEDVYAEHLYGGDDFNPERILHIDDIENSSHKFAEQQEYNKLYRPTNLRDIRGIECSGVSDLLKALAKTQTATEGWIERFAKIFNEDFNDYRP